MKLKYLSFSLCLLPLFAVLANTQENPPDTPPTPEKEKTCPCEDKTTQNGCVYSKLSLGSTSIAHEHFNVNILLYAHEMSPALYTPRVLYVETLDSRNAEAAKFLKKRQWRSSTEFGILLPETA